MPKIESGTFTLLGSVPATKTILFNDNTLNPQLILFFVSSAGASDSDNHGNIGFLHSAGKGGISFYSDTTGERSTQNTGSKVLSHHTRSSGTITEIINASAGAIRTGEFDLTVSALNTSYQIGFLAIEF